MTNVRTWLTNKRAEVVVEMAKLEAKLAVYDDLLRDLPKDDQPRVVLVDKQSADAMLKADSMKFQAVRKPYAPRKPRQDVEVRKHTIDLALEAAGDDGITARQLAEVASIPVGTASGRLSVMKAEGKVRHDPEHARYFAVHSEQQDNNANT